MTVNAECKGILGKIFGHYFISSYDSIPPNLDEFEGSLLAYKRVIELRTRHVYKGSVCKRCGKIVNDENMK